MVVCPVIRTSCQVWWLQAWGIRLGQRQTFSKRPHAQKPQSDKKQNPQHGDHKNKLSGAQAVRAFGFCRVCLLSKSGGQGVRAAFLCHTKPPRRQESVPVEIPPLPRRQDARIGQGREKAPRAAPIEWVAAGGLRELPYRSPRENRQGLQRTADDALVAKSRGRATFSHATGRTIAKGLCPPLKARAGAALLVAGKEH